MGITYLPQYKDPWSGRNMTYGEIGCFLSHYNVWKDVAENGYEKVAVFEDDIRFEPFFRAQVKALLGHLQDLGLAWDLLYLGRKRLSEKEDWVEGSDRLVRPAYSYWTLGYLLSSSGAAKLLRARPLERLLPVDEFLPIMFDRHSEASWLNQFEVRDLVAFSVSPLLLYPTHYTGESGYISDTEYSETLPLLHANSSLPPKGSPPPFTPGLALPSSPRDEL